jgi:hypothetical protein
MRLFMPLLAMLALVLPACAPNPGQGTSNAENMLTAAGFKQRAIKTEAQLANFRSIPAHMIRPATYKGRAVYVYADPTICGCLYMGGPTAYNNYIRNAMARNMRQEYQSETTYSGYTATPQMLDGGPWDDADMYGTYIN